MSVSRVIINAIHEIAVPILVELNNKVNGDINAAVNAGTLIGASIQSIIAQVVLINTAYASPANLSDKTNDVAVCINDIKTGLAQMVRASPAIAAGGVVDANKAATANTGYNATALAATMYVATTAPVAVVDGANCNPVPTAAGPPTAAGADANRDIIAAYVAIVHAFITVLKDQLLAIIAATTHINLFPSLPLVAPNDTVTAAQSTKFYVVLLDATKAVKYVGHRIYNIANHEPITSFVHCRKNTENASVGVQLEILANYDGSRITDSATGIASPDNLKTWLLKYMTDDNLTADKAQGYLENQDTFKAASAYTLDNNFTNPTAIRILGGSKKNKRHRQIKSKSRKYKSKGGQADLNTIIANATNAIF